MTYKELVDKVKNGEPFSFSRMGDGEWSAILGKSGKNCDGHEYFPSLGKHLRQILEERPEYYLGMQNLANRLFSGIPEFDRLKNQNKWINADIIHRQNGKEGIEDLFEALQDKEVVLVGNKRHRGMDKYFPIKHFVEVPEKNAWTEMWDIDQQVMSLTLTSLEMRVVLYCSGMMSNVLIDNYAYLSNVAQIDLGSSLDPYVNVVSRGYHKEHKMIKNAIQ